MLAKLDSISRDFHRIVWEEDPEKYPTSKRRLIRTTQIVLLVFRDIKGGMIPLRAMSLVYTTLLSLVPLLAVSFSVLKGFGVHNQLKPALLNILEPLGEQGIEITQNIIGFVQNINVGVLGALGIGFLLFTVISMIQKIESALNATWRVHHTSSFVQRASNYLSVLLIGPVLVFSAIGLTASVSASAVVQTVMSYPILGDLISYGGRLLPYFIIVAAFTFIYVFVPNTKVHIMPALIGASVAGMLWQLTGWLFTTVIIGTTKYTAIYSAFATLIIFMIWLYASWVICLVGSNIAFYSQNPDNIKMSLKPLVLSSRQEEKIALLCMALIGKHYFQGLKAWDEEGLAHYLSIPQSILHKTLAVLVKAGFLAETSDSPPRLLPAKPAEQIKLSDILSVIRQQGESATFGLQLPADPTLDDIYTDMEDSMSRSLANKTLREISNVEISSVRHLDDREAG